MYRPKPTSRFILLALTLVLWLALISSGTATVDSDDEDLAGFEELVALDEEAEVEGSGGTANVKPSEAEVLTKAQRIVIELNTDSAKRVIEENEFVLVLGYAPWDPRSAELMPQFAEAATELKQLGINILMAKIDGERYPKAASALGIQGIPSLILFVNGSSEAYTGGFTSKEIVIWARKKAGNPVIRIDSVMDGKEFLSKHAVFVVGLFDKYEVSEHEEFVKAATSDNEIQFVETSSTDVANVLFPDIGHQNIFLGLVKSEPERYTRFEGTFKMEDILQFLDHNKFPLVTSVTGLNMARVYSSLIKLQVYVFAEADDFKNLLEPLQDVARKFKSQIMFLYVDIKDDNLAKPFLTFLGLEDSTDTIVAAFENQISSKYLLEAEPSPRKIEDFCLGLLHGTQALYYKSQPIPDNKDAIIQTVVGKSFDDLVLSSPKNIILEVHTPWCLNCETTSKQVEKLAKHFIGLDNLIFARIDASANEHPKLQIDDYPALLFYPAADKTHPVKLPTKSSLKELAALINKNLKKDQDKATKDEL